MDLRSPMLLFLVIFPLTIPVFAGPSFDIAKYSDEIVISENGKPVLHYQRATRSILGQYRRSNYIHPLYNLDGTVITEDFPLDHLHQRGIFWAWHQVLQGENRLGDGWECRDITWDVISADTSPSTSGGVLLETEVLWKSALFRDSSGEMIPFIKENAAITVHPAAAGSRMIDFEIRILALEPEIYLGGSEDEKGYGGFSPRVVLPEDVAFQGFTGPVTPRVNAVNAGPFVDITGTFSGDSRSGITIIQHPANPDFPQGWILRSLNSMQNPAYPGQEPVKVSTTDPLILRYRLVLHGPAEQDLEALFDRYSSGK